MLLKKLEICGYGPFLDRIEIPFEQTVTVITGRNDAGKTKLLRLIQLLYEKESGTSDDMHFDYETRRVEDPTIVNQPTCVATFSATSASTPIITGKSRPKDEIVYSFDVTSNRREHLRNSRAGNDLPKSAFEMSSYPRLLTFPAAYIRSQIFEKDTSQIELKLLKIAFGNKPFDLLKTLNSQQLDRKRDAASDNLTRKLEALTSTSLGLRIQVDIELGENAYIGIRLKDPNNGNSPLDARGSGIRKILTLLALLADLPTNTHPTLILIDEPENSLHADAQHLLRRFLEEIAKNDFVQVIYATHSPSMINPFHPERIRLITQTKSKTGYATSVLINNPSEDNLSPVRMSLGITAADSLLYAPIAIVVEGPTEAMCFQTILEYLESHNVEPFVGIPELISEHCFILAAVGDNYPYWVALARDQGSRPVLFLDGDKARQVTRKDIQDKLQDCPVITLDGRKEFEDILPRSSYCSALQELTGEHSITEEGFNQWLESQNEHIHKMMFSKQVERWLDENGIEFPSKPDVMRSALDKTDVNSIDKKAFVSLVSNIKEIIAQF